MSGPYPNVFGSPLQLKDDEETFAMKSKRCVSAPFLAARFFEGFGDDDDDVDECTCKGLMCDGTDVWPVWCGKG